MRLLITTALLGLFVLDMLFCGGGGGPLSLEQETKVKAGLSDAQAALESLEAEMAPLEKSPDSTMLPVLVRLDQQLEELGTLVRPAEITPRQRPTQELRERLEKNEQRWNDNRQRLSTLHRQCLGEESAKDLDDALKVQELITKLVQDLNVADRMKVATSGDRQRWQIRLEEIDKPMSRVRAWMETPRRETLLKSQNQSLQTILASYEPLAKRVRALVEGASGAP